jgi:hypothetical protein
MAHLISNINILHGGQLTLTGQPCVQIFREEIVSQRLFFADIEIASNISRPSFARAAENTHGDE